jgi:hypothetical protein
MQGRRPPVPPNGYTLDSPPPRPSWRKRKEVGLENPNGFDYDREPAAAKFLPKLRAKWQRWRKEQDK